MKKLILAAILAMPAAITAQARTTEVQTHNASAASVNLEPVDSIRALGRMHGWRALDRDSLLIWTTAFRPYLIRLARPSHDMRFTEVIGVTETAGRVHSRFDSVYIEGIRYPIEQIYRLSPEDAKAL
ncbi:MAG: DUF6491 family protein [Gammaproteobacteria bacterium]|jgi:hypothetical protein